MPNLESDEEVFKRLLQTIAWNDLNGLLDWLARKPDCVNGVGVWNGREMTPLMVAAAYGRGEAVRHILHCSRADVNRRCGPQGVTALHCAASSGLSNAGSIVRLLLNAGANPKLADFNGLLPRDAAVLSPARPSIMHNLKRMLDTAYRPRDMDEFLMQKYKVFPCSDVTEMHCLERDVCGKYHLGADDRRRSPWTYVYSKRSCLSYMRGIRGCPRGDRCRFAHGPWEAGFHPHHYKTMMCCNGVNCNWKLCYFAHTERELRHPPPPLPFLSRGQQLLQERRFMNAVRSYRGNVEDSDHQSSSAHSGESQSPRSDPTTVKREDSVHQSASARTGWSQSPRNDQTKMIAEREDSTAQQPDSSGNTEDSVNQSASARTDFQ